MKLLDQIAQCRTPLLVESTTTGELTRLSGAAEAAPEVLGCRVRYVLSDELLRLCTDLAYSKGARVLECADLIRIPADPLWVEWCESPWQEALRRYGFRGADDNFGGRRGALLRSSKDGRRGSIRTFWNVGDTDLDVFASAMQAHFDLDAASDPLPVEGRTPPLRVADREAGPDGILERCFRFEFEDTWARYYERAAPNAAQFRSLQLRSAGCVAIAIPVLLAFFLLLAARDGLPRQHIGLERLNRMRARAGKTSLLAHVEVRAPLLPRYSSTDWARPQTGQAAQSMRRRPRLHVVRGHLVRRGSELYWRIPHVRGSPRLGTVQSRTVTWTFVPTAEERSAP